MGRDIRVESKHFIYYGSKSSDLIMAFDYYFYNFRKDIIENNFYTAKLSKKEMKCVLDFTKEDILSNHTNYREPNELIEKLNNLYIRMMPKDIVKITVW